MSRPFDWQTSQPECFIESVRNPAAEPAQSIRTATSGASEKIHMPVQDDVIEIEGRITSVLAGTMFRVELANKHLVLAHISGRMRKSFIRLTTGDRVKLEMSPYDLSKARIVYRLQG